MKGTKQSINLTNYAWYILKCDYCAFRNEISTSKNIGAGFLCDIFMKFFQDAQASIGIRMKERETEIRKMLGTHGNDELRKLFSEVEGNRICEATLESYAEIIKNDSQTHTIYIPDSVHCAITEFSMGSEAFYYRSYREADGHYMKYFRAVLEEYARMPFCQRESIFFKEIISRLNAAVNGNYSVRFMYGTDEVYGYPYAVEYDEWSSYNYLLLADENSGIRHYRISRIKSLSCFSADTMELSDTERSIIREKQIVPVGIQFAGEPVVKVQVKLTENGMKMYNRMVFLRPQYTYVKQISSCPEEYLCSFLCSENQIKFYFFKFGADAEVVSPSKLRSYFVSGYLSALKTYKNKQETPDKL